jgi:hypothetical protein
VGRQKHAGESGGEVLGGPGEHHAAVEQVAAFQVAAVIPGHG